MLMHREQAEETSTDWVELQLQGKRMAGKASFVITLFFLH